MPYVLAHGGQFTWDEALLVVAPLLVIALLLWLANRRAKRLAADDATLGEAPADPTAPAASTSDD